jgi:hypothetical protein
LLLITRSLFVPFFALLYQVADAVVDASEKVVDGVVEGAEKGVGLLGNLLKEKSAEEKLAEVFDIVALLRAARFHVMLYRSVQRDEVYVLLVCVRVLMFSRECSCFV